MTENSENEKKLDTKVKELIETTIEQKSENLPAPLPTEEGEIEQMVKQLNHNDRNSVIYFGTKAQEKLDEISNRMIDGVKNKDTGVAGEVLNKMVITIKGFDIDEFNPNKELGFFDKLFGKTKPLAEFINKYEGG